MLSIEENLKEYPDVFVIYDENVGNLVPQIAPAYPSLPIKATEERKTMDTVLDICRWLMAEGAGRDALLLAIGGGITTDTAGFAACIYKRGIRYANVPTTLLAQVDAGTGGKNGVNLDGYKNILGNIVQPEFTYIIPEALETLPERELLCGAAELLKTFIIKNEDGQYEQAVAALKEHRLTVALCGRDPKLAERLAPLIQAAVGIKEEIVGQDPYESGLRRVLNLGHTWAHAIEWRFPGQWSHGEAVAMGIVAAARKSEELGTATEALAQRIAADFKACGLPVDLPCPEEELLPAMKQDKKNEADGLNLVLIEKIGKVIVKKI